MNKFYLLIFFFISFENYSPSSKLKNIYSSNVRRLNEETNSKKNLIIIPITNYDWENLAIFFKSYQKANFENTDFVVFAHNMDESTINEIKSCGIIVLFFPEKYKTTTIINTRWAIVSDYLKKNGDQYNLVFTCDTRDTFFQKDVFKFYSDIKKPFLGLALEDGFIGQSECNRRWVLEAYGEEKYNKIKNERIICMGTVWGTVDKLTEFCDKMWEVLNSEWSIKIKLIDQGLGNYLIYHDKMFNDCIVFSENRDGPVMTIGMTNRGFINLDSDNRILNVKGEIAAVVHQYDRKYDLVQIAKNKYYPSKSKEKNYGLFIYIFFIGVILFSIILCYIYFYRNKTYKTHKLINQNELEIKKRNFEEKLELI